MYKYVYNKLIERVHPEWLPFFEENKDELLFIINELNKMKTIIYPRRKDIFRALYYHSPKDIKLLILGQDPYINEINCKPEAMGLSFSVPKCHAKIPPSLKNIFTEIKNSYPNFNIPKHGLLKKWARKEKILLLNSALTVNKGLSNSHAKLWGKFTDKLIEWFQNNNDKCIFLLMGKFAQSKSKFIHDKHMIFNCVHPSPLSAYNGFFGSNVFKDINEYLKTNNINHISW